MRHYAREASLQHPRACHSAAAGEETAGDEGAGGGVEIRQQMLGGRVRLHAITGTASQQTDANHSPRA